MEQREAGIEHALADEFIEPGVEVTPEVQQVLVIVVLTHGGGFVQVIGADDQPGLGQQVIQGAEIGRFLVADT